jgi:3-oxoacyl-[acyl-carrier-protein] synthase II
MHAKRVVVTGYGAVSALGENVAEIWNAIMHYRVGYMLTEPPRAP